MRRQHGFSLIEILMAILIAGIVAAIAIPVFNGQRDRAKDRAAAAALDTAVKAARSVHASTEDYPTDVAARIANTENTLSAAAGTGFAQGQVQVDRRSATELALRTRSQSGTDLLWIDDVARGRTERLWITDISATVTNLVPNPSVETNTTGWTGWQGTGGTLVASGATTASAAAGSRSFEQTSNAVASASIWAPGTTQISVVPGETLSFRAFGQIVSGSFTNPRMHMTARWADASGAYLVGTGVGPSVTAPLGQWVELSGTTTVPASPAGIARVMIELWADGVNGGQITMRADAFQVTRTGSSPAYIDGDRPGGTWTGTPHASTSTGYDAAPR